MDIPFPVAYRGRGSADLAKLEFVLRENHPLRLTRARGQRLLCTSGCAWITAPGVVEDIYLRPGETWPIPSQGLVLVEAVGSATVVLRR